MCKGEVYSFTFCFLVSSGLEGELKLSAIELPKKSILSLTPHFLDLSVRLKSLDFKLFKTELVGSYLIFQIIFAI